MPSARARPHAWETTAWNRLRYDLLAPVYDLAVEPLREARRRSLAILAPQRGQHVLLVGAGTGLDLELLPEGVRATALDVSRGMLRRAWRRARALPLEADVVQGDGHRLPFRDASFDHVVLHLILAVIPDPVQAAREARRVLKPGGRIVVFDKFLAAGTRPPLWRRAANLVTGVVATDINRQAEPILAAAGLKVVYEEPSALRGFFRILLAEPAGPAS